MIPVRCFSCGKVLTQSLVNAVERGEKPALRYCCSRMVISATHYLDDFMLYSSREPGATDGKGTCGSGGDAEQTAPGGVTAAKEAVAEDPDLDAEVAEGVEAEAEDEDDLDGGEDSLPGESEEEEAEEEPDVDTDKREREIDIDDEEFWAFIRVP